MSVFDRGEGRMYTDEFRHIMMRLGEGMSVKEMDEIITDADPLGEGVINMQNFVQLMKDTQQGAMA